MTLAAVLAAVIGKTGIGVLRAYYILRVRAGEKQGSLLLVPQVFGLNSGWSFCSVAWCFAMVCEFSVSVVFRDTCFLRPLRVVSSPPLVFCYFLCTDCRANVARRLTSERTSRVIHSVWPPAASEQQQRCFHAQVLSLVQQYCIEGLPCSGTVPFHPWR